MRPLYCEFAQTVQCLTRVWPRRLLAVFRNVLGIVLRTVFDRVFYKILFRKNFIINTFFRKLRKFRHVTRAGKPRVMRESKPSTTQLKPLLLSLSMRSAFTSLFPPIFTPCLVLQFSAEFCFADTPAIVDKAAESDLRVKLLTAEFLMLRNQEPKAQHIYQTLAFRDYNPALLERALSISIEQGNISQSLGIARHWVEVDPNNIPALFYLAHLALRDHQYEQASAALDQILTYDPEAALDRVFDGIYPENPEDRQQLLQALKTLEGHDNPALMVLAAGLMMDNHQYVEALSKVNHALSRQPDVSAFIILKANLLQAQGLVQETGQWLESQTRLYPANKSLKLFEIRFLLKQNESAKALKKLDSVIRRWPDDGEILLLAGLISIDQQHYQQAEKYLLQLVTHDDYVDQAYYYLAINAERQQRFTVAETYFKQVQSPELYQKSQQKLALLRVAHNRFNEAISGLTEERVDHPDQATFLYLLQTQLLKNNGQALTARKLLDEALKSAPDDPELLYARILLLGPAETSLLNRDLEKLLAAAPDNPTYLNAYAYALADQNRRLDDARHLAERANSLAPHQSSILDTLGYVALRQGDLIRAVTALQEAYGQSRSFSIGLRLAQTLRDLKRSAEMAQLLSELTPETPDQKAQLQRLKDSTNENTREITNRSASAPMRDSGISLSPELSLSRQALPISGH